MTDLLSITSSRISVACIGKQTHTIVPCSTLIIEVIRKLYTLGYINNFKILNCKEILVMLKYTNNKPVIRRMVRLSTPGKRISMRVNMLTKLKTNTIQGFTILSTSYGILTDQECRFYHIGGEPLFTIF